MAKQITFSYGDRDYTLEFTRKSVKTMERQGFNIQDVNVKPLLTTEALFRGAFLAHHNGIRPDVVEDIFMALDKKGLLEMLVDMYNEPLKVLEPEEDDGAKKIAWTATE